MTAITISNPEQLKEVVLNVLKEHPEILKAAIKEILLPDAESSTETPEARRERMRAMIQGDFDQYEEVFKALA